MWPYDWIEGRVGSHPWANCNSTSVEVSSRNSGLRMVTSLVVAFAGLEEER